MRAWRRHVPYLSQSVNDPFWAHQYSQCSTTFVLDNPQSSERSLWHDWRTVTAFIHTSTLIRGTDADGELVQAVIVRHLSYLSATARYTADRVSPTKAVETLLRPDVSQYSQPIALWDSIVDEVFRLPLLFPLAVSEELGPFSLPGQGKAHLRGHLRQDGLSPTGVNFHTLNGRVLLRYYSTVRALECDPCTLDLLLNPASLIRIWVAGFASIQKYTSLHASVTLAPELSKQRIALIQPGSRLGALQRRSPTSLRSISVSRTFRDGAYGYYSWPSRVPSNTVLAFTLGPRFHIAGRTWVSAGLSPPYTAIPVFDERRSRVTWGTEASEWVYILPA
ncbi:hypothetical protein NMY22_g15870 [Coprinellus aureogranulatus]|nr:hypothetical protein NMY22_g15870 [Coprinellus aureogranulatus]